ncbi:MAG: sigma-70 family RNA polymerase sigma factor [Verrucomicrobiota bacterium]|nr:sigma-70 family RNA polymerase sigma factor [Verrucomicrobiota bacterium]
MGEVSMSQAHPPPVSDLELVRQANSGRQEAFEELTGRYEERVFGLAMRMLRHQQDAEDVTQQAFLSALENLNRFRGEARFATWLFRIATHAALKVLRKRKGAVSLEWAAEDSDGMAAPHPEYIADWRETPEKLAERAETRRLLDEALAALDEKHRVVFILRDVEGLSVRETAEALGISEGNVKVRLLRARLELRERLTREFGDPRKRVAGHGAR